MPLSLDAVLQTVQELLLTARRRPPTALVAGVAAALAPLGATDVGIYLNDYEQRTLRPVLVDDEPMPIEGTMAGRAFSSDHGVEVAVESADGGGLRLWLPLIDGAERLGVLHLRVAALDEELRHALDLIAGLVAELVVTRGAYTDLFFNVRRRREMSMAAEMQWQLLPPLASTTPRFGIAGMLEPAYSVGGDSFDHAYDGATLSFAVFDAMGHGVHSALTSTIAVGSYRHGRRQHGSIEALCRALDAAVGEYRPFGFVTGIIAELDTTTGELRWSNAGHPDPLLLRDRAVTTLSVANGLPFGVGYQLDSDVVPEVGTVGLQPGDRVLLYSDGITDASLDDGERFGEERLAEFLVQQQLAGQGVAETLRRLSHAVIDHAGGRPDDDATVVMVEYLGSDGD